MRLEFRLAQNESKLHFNFIVLCRFTMPTGSRSVMGPVEESSALVAIKLLSPPPSLLFPLLPLYLATYLSHLNYQTGHSHRAIQSRERRRENLSSSSYIHLVGYSASSLLSHAHNFSSPQYANKYCVGAFCNDFHRASMSTVLIMFSFFFE